MKKKTVLRGMKQFVAILATVREGATHHHDIAARIDADVGAVRDTLVHMVRARMVHIVDWVSLGRGVLVPVMAFGPGENVPHPRGYPLTTRAPTSRGLAMFSAFRAVWDALEFPCSRADLREEAGIANCTALLVLRLLRANKLARICEWRRRVGFGGSPTPAFQRGSKPDAPRIKPLTTFQLNQSHRKRHRTMAAATARLAANAGRFLVSA